jgi:hypothetical protein
MWPVIEAILAVIGGMFVASWVMVIIWSIVDRIAYDRAARRKTEHLRYH